MSTETLCEQLIAAKFEEDQAKMRSIEIEKQLAQFVGKKEEGTDKETYGKYVVTVTSKLTRTLDYPAYLAIENDIPEGVRCVRMKPELDLKKLRAMEMVRPGFSAQFVTTKPAKPSVKVEVI